MADVKKIATRESYGNALAECGAEFPNLVVLDADLAGAALMGVRMAGQAEQKRKNWLLAALVLLFLLSLLPDGMEQAQELRLRFSLWLDGFFLLFLPILLLVLAAVRKKGGEAA